MLTKSSRILLACASLLLVVMYFVPLWSISLEAPQYPEGLGLKIHLNTIVGAEPNDLNSINGLNHYIGMKLIEPDSIAELKYMPYLVGIMAFLGLAAAAVGRRAIALGWVGLFLMLSLAGLVDFYLWEYDYGHNLNPHAAIKIEGMSYQPPLIGSKQLLNFRADSYPDIGGVIMGVSLLMGSFAWWNSRKKATAAEKLPSGMQQTALFFGFAVLAALGSCSNGPEPIQFGTDECANCKMTISDKRFGAEILSTKGKTFKFDAVECMAGFENDKKIEQQDISGQWVVDYSQPGEFVPARKAWYLQSENLPSPMGLSLSAYSSKEAFEKSLKTNDGKMLYYDSVRLLVAKEW